MDIGGGEGMRTRVFQKIGFGHLLYVGASDMTLTPMIFTEFIFRSDLKNQKIF